MSDEVPVMGMEQRGWIKRLRLEFNWQQEETVECNKTKPFIISTYRVMIGAFA